MGGFHVRRMIVNSSGRDDLAVVGDTTGSAHRNPVRFTQPVRFETLLGGNGIVAIEYAIVMQERS